MSTTTTTGTPPSPAPPPQADDPTGGVGDTGDAGGRPRIGVLAVQGDVREHLAALTALGAEAVTVRRPAEVEQVDGLVIPGGESTVMDKLVRAFDLREPLVRRIREGLPVYGSCAGMIMLADRIADGRPDQQTLGGLDITVRRNAFGRQVDSFEQDLDYAWSDATPPGSTGTVHAVFIRAPWAEQAGPDVQVLARVSEGAAAGRIVAVRQGNLMATSFHPEVGADRRIHAEFVSIVRAHRLQQSGARQSPEREDTA
ncbi:pyridoxal 5'-phosphate synthase subunit PdxT [Terrabacter tumescens]|uniref:Pyridoxal 5'-phosphate synthase subunit PdxT n=1 Tax=Terrabacter tumescens TaxID=60443 RepID=A0ABQ2HMN9_9MICO|nr:pyridoxal 5'-phosphate synthase subunit PdxT [Terrabacter tumescens]